MDFLRAPYLMYPVIFVLGLFLLDKVFLIPEVRENFIQPGGMLYYSLRKEQVEKFPAELASLAPTEKSVVVFGDSRSFALGDLAAKFFFGRQWNVYNFAGPQAVPAYHAFLAEKLFRGVRRPTYLLMGISPDAFNRNAGIFAVPVLAYGVDQPWIERNRTHIPDRDYETYVSTRRFALAGMQFSLRELVQRLRGNLSGSKGIPPEQMALLGASLEKTQSFQGAMLTLSAVLDSASSSNLSHYSLKRSPQAAILRLGRGAQYAWFGQASDEVLRRDTQRLVSLYLQSFAYSPEQAYFYRRTLQLAREAGVRVLVFQPRVNPYLLQAYKEEPLIAGITREVERVARQEGAEFVDLNVQPEADCKRFYDASHMSIDCFATITPFLIRRLP